MAYYNINNENIFADLFIYVDAATGNDNNDGLTKQTALKTLEQAFTNINKYDATLCIGVIVGDGQYNNNTFVRETHNTNKIMIIGNTINTILYNSTGFYPLTNNGWFDPCKCVMEYYRLVWKGKVGTNYCALGKDVNLYNVAFVEIGDNRFSYFYQKPGTVLRLDHCSNINCGIDFFRVDNNSNSIYVTNSIGNFTSGYNTEETSWNISNNVIGRFTYNTDYIPTDVEYKHLGSDKNPNGTIGNLGVYGGKYGWGEWLRYAIHQDGKYYYIKDSSLVEYNDYITEIEDNHCTLRDINNHLDLLNDTFEIISDTSIPIVANGIKSDKEMIVPFGSFTMNIIENINKIYSSYTKDDNTILKCVFSIDGGFTWKTYNGVDIIDMNIVIPSTAYENMNESELIDWNNAKEQIIISGINISDLRLIDFNELGMEKIKFAYVFSISDPEYACKLKSTICNYNEKSTYQCMDNSEVTLSVLSNAIKITPHIDCEEIRVNILPNGVSQNIIGGTQIEEATEEEGLQFINSLF